MERSETRKEEQEVQELRRLFREAHRDGAVPPPFETLWNRVRAEATTRHRPLPNLRPVVVGILVAAMVTLAIVWSLHRPAPSFAPPTPSSILAETEWDRTWSGWEGPLDFLLDTPGRTYLESVPTILTDEPSLMEAVSDIERSATDAL